MFFRRNKLKAKAREIALDEIFLDSKNLAGFDTERFEGRLEFPLSGGVLKLIIASFAVIMFVLFLKAAGLQIAQGSYFEKRAANNFLRYEYLAAPRGEIYDRNGVLLAWNEPYAATGTDPKDKSEIEVNLAPFEENQSFIRKYTEHNGLSHVLGFLGFNSSASSSEKKFSNFKIGKDGIEKYYDADLEGVPGVKITEVDSVGNLVSSNAEKSATGGKKINLTIDSKINAKFSELISQVVLDKGFKGGAGIIMDVKSGEIISMASAPEYESEILSRGEEKDTIQGYLKNEKNVFLNRAISGIYAPGSVMKPLMALAALNENIITPDKVISTHGSISIENPYKKNEFTVFRDWKNHGDVNMYTALANSSDVYFYALGGGYGGIKGLGIERIKKYAEMFGFNKKTGIDLFGEEEGVIPGPELKQKTNPEDPVWRIGDTYHASIGQENFQVTPIEMVVYASALANKGAILTPRLVKSNSNNSAGEVKKADIPEKYFDVVQKGMRMAVMNGTAHGMNDLNVSVAGKTGTAEIGKKYVNSWFVGFWPYENPRYSIVVVLEKGFPHNLIGGVYVARQLLGWMQYSAPEYLKP